ncbi:subtilase-type protease inhibitor [Streptomyces pactum]|uniref:Probable subtilase-type protease inhibitor n=1 Tax=Streptomyces pactum TaxID=68249 RepID=A0ABS0NG19_9ACTN|nr:subtilase-type protease inhibitor [Streptomyces pactum]MBH5334138.1 subtilase-type protease inhibitor [Streptomyces pactum]
MRKIAGAIGLGAALTAGCLVAAGGASAEQAQPRSLYAPSALVLTVGQGEDARTATVQRAVTLSCTPTPTGTHPAPAEACAELSAVNGDFSALRATGTTSGQFCTKDYRPVVVTAQGVWQGRSVRYERTFSNSCVMQGTSNAVFAF